MAESPVHLFAPAVATRVRWNENTDTPLPPEEPASQNPPDGAILYYWLAEDIAGPVELDIVPPDGVVFNRFLSTDRPPVVDEKRLQIRPDWVRPAQVISAKRGMHRFVWDLHLPPVGEPTTYPIAAIRGDTPAEPRGPWVMPGKYTVRLTAGDKIIEQPLTVQMDPRVITPKAELDEQYRLSYGCWFGARNIRRMQNRIQEVRRQIADRRQKADDDLKKELTDFDAKLAAIAGAGGGGRSPRDHVLPSRP